MVYAVLLNTLVDNITIVKGVQNMWKKNTSIRNQT